MALASINASMIGPSDPAPRGDSDAPENPAANTTVDMRSLTQAVQRGDAAAFAQLYDLFSFRIYKFLLVAAQGDEAAAREVSQTVWIKLAKRSQVFDDERPLWAWLRTVARNCFVDHCRASRKQCHFVELDPETEDGAGTAVPHQLSEPLKESLERLPEEDRELLQAAYVDRRPIQEIADSLGLTYKAIESRLGRIRQKLKSQLLKNLRHETEL